MLARGELHCIGATTLAEYRLHMEKDAAFERRFQQVLVGEPSVEVGLIPGHRNSPAPFLCSWSQITDSGHCSSSQAVHAMCYSDHSVAWQEVCAQAHAVLCYPARVWSCQQHQHPSAFSGLTTPLLQDTVQILRGLSEKYSSYHGVRIHDRALVMAAVLADRYITARFLPDKAIDVVDEACSNLRVQLESMPEQLDAMLRQQYRLQVEEAALAKEKDPVSRRASPKVVWRPTLLQCASTCKGVCRRQPPL